MKFGKLANIENVDFTLPADPSFNRITLKSEGVFPQPKKLYLGCTGWSMKEWVGSVYPSGTKSNNYLNAYSKQFNTIELNTTHYRIPNTDTIANWKNQSTADFKFCPKIPQTISHSRNLGIQESALPQFCQAISGLEEKLGCCFIQLPPYFGLDRLPLLERFFEAWPQELPLAIEVRHESWFAADSSLARWLECLHKHHKTAVITDVAGRRDVLHMGLTTNTCMIRFVGNGLHSTDYQRADAWIQRLSRWYAQGLEEVYFFPHQPDNIHAPEMAVYLFELSKKIPDIQTRGPKLIEEENGQQMRLF